MAWDDIPAYRRKSENEDWLPDKGTGCADMRTGKGTGADSSTDSDSLGQRRTSRIGRRRKISSKALSFAESVIRQMTRMAAQYGALNLAQGMPDFQAPAKVKDAAVRAIVDDMNQYEITWGSYALRRAIADKALRYNGISCDPETDLTVTCGSTEAMTASIIAIADPGDEVIVPEPFYENYTPATVIAGAKPKHVLLLGPDGKLDEERLKGAFTKRTKAILVNTPNNPSGRVLTRRELRLIADLCRDYDTLAIADEIYEYIVYDGRKHVSLASLAGMLDRTITISGLSKTYSLTGWRVGYAIANREITNGIRKVHDFTTVCAPTPFQRAGVEALNLPRSYYSELAKDYQRRRDLIVRSLRDLGFGLASPEGAYYVLADFSSISGKDDVSFAGALAKEGKVATVPGSSFYSGGSRGEREVRFSFARRDEILREAMGRVKAYLGN